MPVRSEGRYEPIRLADLTAVITEFGVLNPEAAGMLAAELEVAPQLIEELNRDLGRGPVSTIASPSAAGTISTWDALPEEFAIGLRPRGRFGLDGERIEVVPDLDAPQPGEVAAPHRSRAGTG